MRGGDQSARHRAVVRAVRDAAPSVGWVLWPIGQTSGPTRRPVVPQGFPDLIGCNLSGTLVGVEVKTGKGKLTKAQMWWREEFIVHREVIHLVVSSVDDFLAQARRGR